MYRQGIYQNGPVNPTMFGYEWKVKECSSCSVQEAECLNWSLAYAGILKKKAGKSVEEWVWQQVDSKQAKSKELPSWLPADGMAQISLIKDMD